MTLTGEGVYQGNGVVKLDCPVALEANTKVHSTIEAEAEAPAAADDDPTGWKTARELIGCITEELRASDASVNHDRYIYRPDR